MSAYTLPQPQIYVPVSTTTVAYLIPSQTYNDSRELISNYNIYASIHSFTFCKLKICCKYALLMYAEQGAGLFDRGKM